jgi:hypothetical protein
MNAAEAYAVIPSWAMYFPSRLTTWLALDRAVSAFDTDIAPDLSPLSPIFSRISPRVRPPGLLWIIPSNAFRLLPLRPCGASLTLLGCFVSVYRREFPVDRGKLLCERLLLGNDHLAFFGKTVTLLINEGLKSLCHSFSPLLIGEIVASFFSVA